MKLIAKDLREQKKDEKDINKSIANKLQRVFERPWQHTQHNREFAFVNMQKKRAGIIVKRWLVMRDVVDAGIDFIRISVIGYNRELYKKWMNIDNFNLILSNLIDFM